VSRVTGSSGANIASGTDITLQIGDARRIKLKLQRVKVRRLAGSAANFTPRVFSASGASNADIDQEFQGAATAVGSLFDSTDINAYCYTDTNGRLYLRPGPDAGADNQFAYQVYYEILS
jgi:hypothetical protein